MRLAFSNTPAAALLLLLSSFAATAAADKSCFDGTSRFAEQDFDFCQQIQADLFLYYKPFMEEGNMMLGLHATQDTFGWTALALAGNGGMKGASQIVVRQDEDGAWTAEDRNSQDYATPQLDESQDVKLLFADQTEAGETSWAVLVPLNSCDSDDYPIEDISVYMHWAFGNDHTFAYHGTRRGQFHANLMRAPKEPPSTDGIAFVDILMPDVPVVLGDGGSDPSNPYICSFFNLDEMSNSGNVEPGTKVHVTRFEPVLDEDSKQYVHHMILYACSIEDGGDDDSDAMAYEHLKIVPECESMPSGCYIMKWPWAVGSEEVVFPENVGLPFGGEQNWVVLQMHYYNPTLDTGIMDSSGVRAYFTPELRPEEAGVMEFNSGTNSWQREAIPAGQSDHAIQPMIIPSSCTANTWADPITVLGVAHHMHLSGLSMAIDVEREGRNLGPLRNEKLYDFNHQSLEETALGQLLPGDKLSVHCSYDTTGVTEDVEFGDLTQQEMCYAAVLYYPLQEQESFYYEPILYNSTECFTAGTGEFAEVSACAQSFFENVPKWFGFEDAVEEPFNAFTMCNGDFFATFLVNELPNGTCPDCYMTQNCTAEEIIQNTQDGLCLIQCNEVGVSLYPNVSDTVPFEQGLWGCAPDENGVWMEFIDSDMVGMQESPNCTFRGDLSQDVELQEAPIPVEGEDEASSDGPTTSGLAGLIAVFAAFFLTLFASG